MVWQEFYTVHLYAVTIPIASDIYVFDVVYHWNSQHIVPVLLRPETQHVINTAVNISPLALGLGLQIIEIEFKVVPKFFHASFQFASEILMLVTWRTIS